MDKIEIIKIDSKNRILIPQSILEVLNIQEKKKPKVMAIWSKEKREIRIKHLDIEKLPPNTATFYLESEVLPERYEKNIEGFMETIWDRKAEFKKGKKVRSLEVEEGRKITVSTSKIDIGGRIYLPKILRNDLNLEKGSFLMAITNREKNSIKFKKAIAVQIKKNDSLELRFISPIPEDLDAYKKKLDADEVGFFTIESE